MAAEQSKLLTSLETEVRHLMFLYQKIKKEKDELVLELEKIKKDLFDTQGVAREWEMKYENLKLVKILSKSDEQEAKKTQHRLSKLEREIEKCIALLNE